MRWAFSLQQVKWKPPTLSSELRVACVARIFPYCRWHYRQYDWHATSHKEEITVWRTWARIRGWMEIMVIDGLTDWQTDTQEPTTKRWWWATFVWVSIEMWRFHLHWLPSGWFEHRAMELLEKLDPWFLYKAKKTQNKIHLYTITLPRVINTCRKTSKKISVG